MYWDGWNVFRNRQNSQTYHFLSLLNKWKLIKRIQNKDKIDNIIIMEHGWKLTIKETVNYLNEFFSKVPIFRHQWAFVVGKCSSMLLFNIYVTSDGNHLKDVIRNMNSSNPSGKDYFSINLFMKSFHELSFQLVFVIIIIHKNDTPHKIENYRFISILSSIGKQLWFDCLKILYDKLKRFGIRVVALTLINCSLQIRNSHSGTKAVDQGELQCSKLSPLLSLI